MYRQTLVVYHQNGHRERGPHSPEDIGDKYSTHGMLRIWQNLSNLCPGPCRNDRRRDREQLQRGDAFERRNIRLRNPIIVSLFPLSDQWLEIQNERQ
jgi:hypothetical protein